MAESNSDKNSPGRDEKSEELSNSFLNESSVVWVDTEPECSVCLQPCLQPVKLPCEHIFCFLCVKGFAYRSKRCALCRSEVTLDYFNAPTVVKVKDCHSPTTTVKDEIYHWFYEGRNGWWQYDTRASSILEDAYTSEARSCELNIAGFIYLINFENMVQFRKSHPARCRRIKRDKSGVDRKGIAGLKVRSKTADTNKDCEKEEDLDTNKGLQETLHSGTRGSLNDKDRIHPQSPQSLSAIDELTNDLDRTL